MESGQGGGGRRADRGEFQVTERREVAPALVEPLDEVTHAVGRCEDQPIVACQALDCGVERCRVGDRPHLDCRCQQHKGAECFERDGRPAALVTWPGEQDPLAEERQAFEPGKLLAQSDNRPDDQQSRGVHRGLVRDLRERRQGSNLGALRGRCAAFNDGSGCFAGLSKLQQCTADGRQVSDAHINHKGTGKFGECRPV